MAIVPKSGRTSQIAWLSLVVLWLYSQATASQATAAHAGGIVGGAFTVVEQDNAPPAAVIDLAVVSPTASSLTLIWTAPGDDGNQGTATRYAIRYASAPITTEAQWQAAAEVAHPPGPKPAGSIETFVVIGLDCATTYYFALKTADEVPNWSTLSNSSHGTTLSLGARPTTIYLPIVLSPDDRATVVRGRPETWLSVVAPGERDSSETAIGGCLGISLHLPLSP